MFRVLNRLSILLSVVALALLSSCNDPDLVGVDLQPASEQPNVGVIDTFTINTYTVEEDSLVMWSPLKNLLESPTLYLGSLDDPYVGKSFAGFVSQIRLGNTITSGTFAGVTTPDSIVLSMNMRAIVGDSEAVHNISVYELKEDLYTDSSYYSARNYSRGDLLGHVQLVPELVDSAVVGGTKVSPQLRMPLDTAFGGKLMREYISNPTTFSSNTNFLSYLKGVVLVDSANGTGSILTMPSTSSFHKLTIYFSGNKYYEFLIDANAVRFSYFKHDYLPSNTDLVQDNQLVVSSMAGLKDSIFIPHLKELYANGPIAISKAELVIKRLSGSSTTGFLNHDNLLVFGSDSLGKNTSIADALESTTYYGGSYDATHEEYKFNVARYVQQTLKKVVENGGKDYGLFIAAAGSTSNARRSVLQGGTSMKLIVTYTKINP
jgi:hypothetical protein